MMKRRPCHRFATSALLALSALPALAQAPAIVLDDVRTAEGIYCREAEGTYVVLLAPEKGLVVFATRIFPGGRPVGAIDGDRLHFDLDGIDTTEFVVASGHTDSVPVWGMLDRTLDVGDHSGCFSFDDRPFTSVDDFKTYLHWLLRDLFFRLGSGTEIEPLALHLGDRTVALEVTPSGHRPLRLEVLEGGLTGLRLPGSETVYYFQPLILDAGAGRLAVKILVKEGNFFTAEAADEIAFLVVEGDEASTSSTDPRFEIRCAGVR